MADHDVCLGIFGTGAKAPRVVPNKVFQGAAAGCAIVTSDTAPQRRVLGDAARARAAGRRGRAGGAPCASWLPTRRCWPAARAAASELARTAFTPAAVTAALHERLLAVVPRRTTS